VGMPEPRNIAAARPQAAQLIRQATIARVRAQLPQLELTTPLATFRLLQSLHQLANGAIDHPLEAIRRCGKEMQDRNRLSEGQLQGIHSLAGA